MKSVIQMSHQSIKCKCYTKVLHQLLHNVLSQGVYTKVSHHCYIKVLYNVLHQEYITLSSIMPRLYAH